MRQIHLDNEVFEFSEYEFLVTVRDVGRAACGFIQKIYGDCAARPDVRGNSIKLLESFLFGFRREDTNHPLESEIEDSQLRETFGALWTQVRKIEDIHDEAVEWIAKFFGKYPLAAKKDRNSLAHKLDRELEESQRLAEPTRWAVKPEYQAFIKEMANIFNSAQVLQEQIERRVDRLLEILGEEVAQPPSTSPTVVAIDNLPPSMRKLVRPYGWTPSREGDLPLEEVEKHAQEVLEKHGMVDQKVSDLVEEAELEIDPREAIQVLRKALRYSPHGIGASKVYFYIAMKYEDLGDKTRAITYYTKSIEETEPSSIVLYYRGMLRYEKGQLEEARRDIEQAIALSGLDSYDLEQARNYLTEIDKQISIRPSDKPKKKKKQ